MLIQIDYQPALTGHQTNMNFSSIKNTCDFYLDPPKCLAYPN